MVFPLQRLLNVYLSFEIIPPTTTGEPLRHLSLLKGQSKGHGHVVPSFPNLGHWLLIFGGDSRSYEDDIFCTVFKDASQVHEVV